MQLDNDESGIEKFTVGAYRRLELRQGSVNCPFYFVDDVHKYKIKKRLIGKTTFSSRLTQRTTISRDSCEDV